MFRFTCGERKICSPIKILWTWLSAKFSLALISLLIALIAESSPILEGTFLKKLLRKNWYFLRTNFSSNNFSPEKKDSR